MGHHFGAYTWVIYQYEGGGHLFVRSTGVTDPNKGTLYKDRAGNDIWLIANPTEWKNPDSHKYQSATSTIKDPLRVTMGQRIHYIPVQPATPNI
jgi:hypothetical protein